MKENKKSIFKYQQIRNMIAAEISIGAYPDNFLPSEQELSLKYKAGRNIIRLALTHLEKENLIIKEQGRRTRIIANPVENNFSRKKFISLQNFEFSGYWFSLLCDNFCSFARIVKHRS